MQKHQCWEVWGRITGNTGSPLELSLEDVHLAFWPPDTL